jgi:ABC-2 type transport system permease protein
VSLDVQRGSRRAETVVAAATAKRAARSGAVWGALFGLLVMNEALSYHTNFPTAESRAAAVSAGASRGLTAVIGPAREVDTVGGWMAWRTFGLLIIVGAIWGLLAATRLLRREEDTGRWELYLAGQTARRHAAGQGLSGLAAGFLTLWALTAALTVISGSRPTVELPVSASLFYATAVTASAAMFLAIGALASQLSATRRQANGLAAAVFGLAYVIRMIADSGTGLAWLRWASPIGWVENLRPFTGSQPLALLPILALTAAAATTAVVLAGRRDLGAGVLTRRSAAEPSTRLLGGPIMLTVRLERWVAVSWTVGLAVLALIFGVTAATVGSTKGGAETVEQAVARLGGQATGPTAWIGYEFVFIAALVAFAVANQVSALRGEEADGYLDNLLARHVSRQRWLLGRLGLAVLFLTATGLATGIGAWIGLATGTSDVTLGAMIQAGLNTAVPGMLVIGIGTLLYSLAPRLAAPILYTLILWSFLIEIIGSSITTNHWLLDTAMLSHLGPVPATDLNWTAIAWFTGLSLTAAAAGLALFRRRDLTSA